MRHQDWPTRMDEALRDCAQREFRYGRFDCCVFVAYVLEAMTGHDYLAAWRYSNRYEAQELVREYAGLEGAVSQELGAPIPVKQAKRGDVVMVEDDGGSLGICVGSDVLYPARPWGLAQCKLSDGLVAWSV